MESNMSLNHATHAVRGTLVYFRDDPFKVGTAAALVHHSDGLLVLQNDRILACGDAAELIAQLAPGVPIENYRDSLILPGFIDAHLHYVQAQIIGSWGCQLLDWLQRYSFVAEQRFSDSLHAARIAAHFCDELLRNGTTTAASFCAVYPQSVDALFEAATQRGMRMIAGKVMMDRNAPAALCDTAQSSYDESEALLRKWHKRGRMAYAITPRYAGSSTPAQLELAGALWREYPDAHVQSHIAENLEEVAWMRKLYPERRDYADIYDHYGLLGPRAMYAHGIHLSARELQRFSETGAAIAHCPSSNLFLGSGLFQLQANKRSEPTLAIALGSDIGAGTSCSMLHTMRDAYHVAQLNGQPVDAAQTYYLATLGAARALHLEKQIGSLRPGLEADFIVLDPRATPALALRMEICRDIEEVLFALMIQGDDRAVRATYIAGKRWRDPRSIEPTASE